MYWLMIRRISGDKCVWQRCSDTQQRLLEREDHVIGAEGAVYKASTDPVAGAVTIHNGQASGKYMVAI